MILFRVKWVPKGVPVVIGPLREQLDGYGRRSLPSPRRLSWINGPSTTMSRFEHGKAGTAHRCRGWQGTAYLCWRPWGAIADGQPGSATPDDRYLAFVMSFASPSSEGTSGIRCAPRRFSQSCKRALEDTIAVTVFRPSPETSAS